MEQKYYYVYILTNYTNNVLYIGMTGDLAQRVESHIQKRVKGFTSKYYVYKLIYWEEFENVYNAIAREKKLKKWRRQWKIDLIKSRNPKFLDLRKEIPYT